MTDQVSIVISSTALILSGTNLWLTLLKKGSVRMTQPTIVCFSYDVSSENKNIIPKIFLRTLLYSTSKRGIIIENMFVKLQCGNLSEIFGLWALGDEKLVRGSGIYVGFEGIASNHHFLLSSSSYSSFEFLKGHCTLHIYASIVGKKKIVKLSEVNLEILEEQKRKLLEQNTSLWFDWEANSNCYTPKYLT